MDCFGLRPRKDEVGLCPTSLTNSLWLFVSASGSEAVQKNGVHFAIQSI